MSVYFILPTMFLSLFDIFHCLPGVHSVQFFQIFSFMNDLFCCWPLYYKFQWEYVQVWEFLSDSLVIFNSLWIIFWTDPLLNHVMHIFFAYDHFNTDSPCVVLMFVFSADSNMGLSVCMFCDFFFVLIACSSFWNSICKNSLRPGLRMHSFGEVFLLCGPKVISNLNSWAYSFSD